MKEMRLTQGFAIFLAIMTVALAVFGRSAGAQMLPITISMVWAVVLGVVAGLDLRSDRRRISELEREVDQLRRAMRREQDGATR